MRLFGRKEGFYGEKIYIPFINLSVKFPSKGSGEFTLENHFISQLNDEERIILLSKKLPVKEQFRYKNALEPFFKKGKEALESLIVGYDKVVEKLEAMPRVSNRDFGRAFLVSEFKRLFIGGGRSRIEPVLSEERRLRFLKSLYELSIIRGGEKPMLTGELMHYVEFYYNERVKEFRTPHKEYDRFSRVLTNLLRRGRISIKLEP